MTQKKTRRTDNGLEMPARKPKARLKSAYSSTSQPAPVSSSVKWFGNSPFITNKLLYLK